MSIYSRDYMRDDPGRPTGRLGPSSWSVVAWLIAINIVVFLVDAFLRGRVADTFGLNVTGLTRGWIWTPVTYQFVHGSVFHLLFNMVMLFFLGRVLLQLAGTKHFLRIFFIGGILGGLLQLLFSFFTGENANVMGASGSALAVTFAVATLIPHQSFRLLFPPVTLTIRQVAYIIVGIDVFFFLLTLLSDSAAPGGRPGTAYVAHFGGMLFGWFYIRFFYTRSNAGGNPRKSRRFGIRILKDDEPAPSKKKKKQNAEEKEPYLNEQIDALLDKINEHGFQSLTDEERKALERSSKKLSRRNKRES